MVCVAISVEGARWVSNREKALMCRRVCFCEVVKCDVKLTCLVCLSNHLSHPGSSIECISTSLHDSINLSVFVLLHQSMPSTHQSSDYSSHPPICLYVPPDLLLEHVDVQRASGQGRASLDIWWDVRWSFRMFLCNLTYLGIISCGSPIIHRQARAQKT